MAAGLGVEATAHEKDPPQDADVEMASTRAPSASGESDKDALLQCSHDKTDSPRSDGQHRELEEESLTGITLQILFPFLLAGGGMVAAGLVLDIVKDRQVFEDVPEIYILVPALLGLKGNLEMTLSSRLGTHAALGNLNTWAKGWPIVVGNLALIQVQSIVVGFMACVVAASMGHLTDIDVSFDHFVVLCTASIITASMASFILALVMVIVVIISKRIGCNPDNIAAPIAASLGDLTTLSVLAFIADNLYLHGSRSMQVSIVSVYCLIVAPICAVVANHEQNARIVLRQGWTPVLSSMAISSSGGLIMAKFEHRFPRMAAFQPVMNGGGGNLVAVQACRIGTHLHMQSDLGKLVEDDDSRRSLMPCSIFCSRSAHTTTARILETLVIPGHLIFFILIKFAVPDEADEGYGFFCLYVTAALIQEWILLYACQHLVHDQWKKGIDPDSAAVPYLTALGDLCGTALLTLVFQISTAVASA